MGKHADNSGQASSDKVVRDGKHRADVKAIVTQEPDGYSIKTPDRAQGPEHGYESTR